MPPKKNNRVDPIVSEEDFQCVTCMELPKKVMVTTDCGHLYCDDCIAIILGRKGKAKCAVCRAKFTWDTVHHCVRTQRQINAFPTECPSDGCAQMIARSDIAKHLETCPEAEVSCPHAKDGCEAVIKRKDVQAHLKGNEVLHLKLQVETLKNMMEGQRTHVKLRVRSSSFKETQAEFKLWGTNWQLRTNGKMLWMSTKKKSRHTSACTLRIIPVSEDVEPLRFELEREKLQDGSCWVEWKVNLRNDQFLFGKYCFVEVQMKRPPQLG